HRPAVSPTGRTAIVLGALAVAALALPWWLAAAGVFALAGAVLADAAAVRRPVPVRRTVPHAIARGVPARLQLGVDDDASDVTGKQRETADLRVADRLGEGGLARTVTGRRRGDHVLPAPAVRATGPLRLASWTRNSGESMSVRVYPDLPAARRIATS